MYPEPSPTDGIESLVVSVDDGTVFRVSPVHFGGPNAKYPKHLALRWLIQRVSPPAHGDDRPNSYVGPPIQLDRSAEAVRALFNDWWTSWVPEERR